VEGYVGLGMKLEWARRGGMVGGVEEGWWSGGFERKVGEGERERSVCVCEREREGGGRERSIVRADRKRER
jgi:hypothetical protein